MDPRESGNEGLAVLSFKLVEPRAVHDPRYNFLNVERFFQISSDDSVYLVDRVEGRLEFSINGHVQMCFSVQIFDNPTCQVQSVIVVDCEVIGDSRCSNEIQHSL